MERTYRNDARMVIKLCIDKFIKDKAYPNLATLDAIPYTPSWRQFSLHSPFSEPVMLIENMQYHNVPYKIVPLPESDNNTFYPIALSFYDFSIQWFKLLDKEVIRRLKTKKLKLLFYYSEGDNPYIIDEHISHQCKLAYIPREQVKFISANSEANNIPNFQYVVDDELLFSFRNRKIPPIPFHKAPRSKKFTALVRMHKYWRANIMAKIWERDLHNEGYFAYGNEITANETEEDNPIEVDNFGNLRELTRLFLKKLPFKADTLSTLEHNTHTMTVNEHFNNSYLNVIIESHMDVDQSSGILLTEKTFKPIKNAQPFIIFGAKGSLQQLRNMGYKIFDDVIDQGYDSITNTTERWNYAIDVLLNLLSLKIEDLHDIYRSLESDIIHNQQLFLNSKSERITKIINQLYD